MLRVAKEQTILITGFFAILAMMGLIVFIGLRNMGAMTVSNTADERAFEKVRLAYQMSEMVQRRFSSISHMEALDDLSERDTERQNFNQVAEEFTHARDRYVALGLLPEEKALLDELALQLRIQQSMTDRAIEMIMKDNHSSATRQAVSDLFSTLGPVTKALHWMLSQQEFLSQKRLENTETREIRAKNAFIAATAGTLIVSLIIAGYVVRRESGRTSELIRENKQREWAERKIRDMNLSLEFRVEERTRDLKGQISEREKIEDQLRDSERRNRTIVDTAAIGIIVIDVNGIIESFNPAAENTFQLSADRAIGRNVSMLMPEPYKSEHNSYLKTYLETGKANIIGIGREVTGYKGDGQTFFGHLSISAFEINGERKYVGMVDDISEQKLAETQILRTKEEAEIANLAKSEFLANMSHELRTPLNAVIGYSEAMSMEMFGPLGHEKYLEYVGNITHSGRHLLDLVNDILDISAIEAGRMELQEEVFDITALVQECAEHIRGWSSREEVDVIFDHDASNIWIRADRRRIRQIILNLLSNSIKFTRAGGRVSLDAYTSDGGKTTISVEDTGVGIAPENISKAFSPFQQIDRGTVSRHEGTGLGLPLSQRFALLHGGDIHMESTPGKGTIVRLTMPKARLVPGGMESMNI